jgi:ribosomal protein S18 acetylase RimI-like enzyme
MSPGEVLAAGLASLRPAKPDDEAFLEGLFADSRADLAALPLPAEALTDLVTMQFQAQRAQYRARYPRAIDEVIEFAGRPIGRCWTDLSSAELRLLDLIVLTGARRRGAARAVLEHLSQRSANAGVPIRLTVWADNAAARQLYVGSGFSSGETRNGYLSMELAHAAARASSEPTRGSV